MTRQLTGRHVAAIFVAFFAVVIAVNVAMAHLASSTFGGAVVENSYVASQHFNRWLDEADRASALGWNAEAKRVAGGRIAVTLTGRAAAEARLSATARHPLGRLADRQIAFVPTADGHFISHDTLPPGRWTLRLTARTPDATWRAERELY